MLVPPPPLKYPRVSAVGHSRWSPSDSPAVVAFHWRLLNKRQRPLGRSAEDPHRLLHLWQATAVGTGGWRFHSAVLAGIPISSYKRSRNQTIVALGLPSMLTSQHFSAVGDRLTRQKVHHKVTGGFSSPPKLPRHTLVPWGAPILLMRERRTTQRTNWTRRTVYLLLLHNSSLARPRTLL